MSEDLVTVATFPNEQLAHLAMQHLQGAGIQSFVSDENSSALFGAAIGWVKLLAAKEEALRAVAVLEAEMPPDPPPSEDIMAPGDDITRRDQIGTMEPDDEPEEVTRRADLLAAIQADAEETEGTSSGKVFFYLFPIAALVLLVLVIVLLWVVGTPVE